MDFETLLVIELEVSFLLFKGDSPSPLSLSRAPSSSYTGGKLLCVDIRDITLPAVDILRLEEVDFVPGLGVAMALV